MKTKRLRCKRTQAGHSGPGKTIAAAVFAMITTVFLLIGFSGPSLEFKLPGLAGWIYICVVIGVATTAFVWLFHKDRKRKVVSSPRIKTVKPPRVVLAGPRVVQLLFVNYQAQPTLRQVLPEPLPDQQRRDQ